LPEDRSVDLTRPEPTQVPVRTLEVLFVMRNLDGYLRYFASALELLVDRGHSVRLLLQRGDHTAVDQAWLDRMVEQPRFTYEIADHFTGNRWSTPAREIRRSLEYVRHLDPGFAERPADRWRSERRSGSFVKRLTSLPLLRTRTGTKLLSQALEALDKAVPRPAEPAHYLHLVRPDLLALCDYGHAGSLYSAYVEAAQARGIPSAICVASWDNLSTRQLFRVTPEALLVWNEEQVREATAIHGIHSERIVVTGAQCFDHWFGWRPRRAASFHERIGLDPGRPYVLWVGGALNPSERSEPEYVRDWLEAVRASASPLLRELGALLRPHPKRLQQWRNVDYSAYPGVAMWPREGMTMPTDETQRADYYDSIFHSAAVVGINSSAMIESAIIGRPVLGLLTPEFSNSQTGTLHFSYLTESGGGVVRTATSLDEHFAQLEAVLEGVDASEDTRRAEFVERFVRPHGIERPATPLFVGALERVAETAVDRPKSPIWLAPLRVTVICGVALAGGWQRASRFAPRLRTRVRRGLQAFERSRRRVARGSR
jgi:hypothetical protein